LENIYIQGFVLTASYQPCLCEDNGIEKRLSVKGGIPERPLLRNEEELEPHRFE
jgi:hypothetical protein